jgi:hypothetical protein
MISKTTTYRLVKVLAMWQATHGIRKDAVQALLDTFTVVPGNKSFTDSTSALKRMYDECYSCMPPHWNGGDK